MKHWRILTAVAAGLTLSAATSQAAISLDFGNANAEGIQFNGSASSFQFDPLSGSIGTPQFQITSEQGGSAAVGLAGWVNNGPWSIGAITVNGTLQTANVTGTGSLAISDGSGKLLTGNVNWVTIQTSQNAGAVNAGLVVNVGNLAYTGTNPDLLSFVHQMVAMDVTFQFSPGMTLTQLTTGAGPYTSSFSGSMSGVSGVPEPTTMLAVTLLVLPFGASAVKIIRKNRTA
jgi:hypothetical protein